MYKIISAVIISALIPCLCFGSYDTSNNLVGNGDFEDGTFLWSWTTGASVVSDDAGGGIKCAQVSRSSDGSQHFRTNRIAVTPGEIIQLKFFHKYTNHISGQLKAYIRYFNSNGTFIRQTVFKPSNTSAWELKTYEAVVDNGGVQIDVMFWLDTSTVGTYRIDNVEIFRAQLPSVFKQGYNCLFMGHSFFAPILYYLPIHTSHAGITHQQMVVFHGGAEGAPGALWNSTAQDVVDAKAWIQTGEVELIGLTGFTSSSGLSDYRLWIDYALQYNPDTFFIIQAPWPVYYSSPFWLYEYNSSQVVLEVHQMLDQLRNLYPNNRFRCVPQSRWMTELWRLHNQGDLSEITALKGSYDTSLFIDDLGHGGLIPEKYGALMWLSIIYNYDLRNYQYDTGVQADLKLLSHQLLHEDIIYYGINLIDFSLFADAWHSTPGDSNWNSECNLNNDSVIDIEDLAVLLDYWLY